MTIYHNVFTQLPVVTDHRICWGLSYFPGGGTFIAETKTVLGKLA